MSGISKIESNQPQREITRAIESKDHPRKGAELACYLPHLVVLLVYAVFGTRLFFVISRYAVNVFYWDQWDFNNATLFEHHSLWQIFRWQHGPHRQGLGGILEKLLEPLIRWNTRYESFGIGAIVVVAAVLALYLKKRMFGRIGHEDVIIPLLFLTPVQYEGLLSTPNPAHGPLPLLLMILYCLSWTVHRQLWRYCCVLLTNFLLIYTGFGVFTGFLTPLLIAAEWYRLDTALRRGNHVASAFALLVSVLSVASFFIGYRPTTAAPCSPLRPQSLARYVEFMAVMFANFLGIKESFLVAELVGGGVLLAVLVGLVLAAIGLVSSSKAEREYIIIPGALLAYCFLFCLSAAVGRLCIGLDAAQGSRYTTYLILGFFGLYLCARSVRRSGTRIALLWAVLVLALLSALRLHKSEMQSHATEKRAWVSCYFSRHDIQQCDLMTNFKIYPWPEATHLQQKLDFLKEHRLNLYGEPND
jgi:hypothetical protein